MYGRAIYSVGKTMTELKLIWQRWFGLEFGPFIALSNMIQELSPVGFERPIEKVWRAYLIHNRVTEWQRRNPKFFCGFSHVEGLENLNLLNDEGGIVVSFHFGDYRYIGLRLWKEMTSLSRTNRPVFLLVDRDSFNNELKLRRWQAIKNAHNVKSLIAESPQVGRQIIRILRKGGILLSYIDGNTGVGNPKNPLRVRFVSSHIQLRSGLFRLAAHTGKPLIPVIARRSPLRGAELVIHPPLFVMESSVQEAAQKCIDVLRNELEQYPEYWRFWYRHHLWVYRWTEDLKQVRPQPALPYIRWVCRETSPSLGLEVSNGRIYEIGK